MSVPVPNSPHNKKDRQVHLTDIMDNTPPTEPSFTPESPEIDVHSPSPEPDYKRRKVNLPPTEPSFTPESPEIDVRSPSHSPELSPEGSTKIKNVNDKIMPLSSSDDSDLDNKITTHKNVNDKIMPLSSSDDSDSDNKITTHAKAPTEQSDATKV